MLMARRPAPEGALSLFKLALELVEGGQRASADGLRDYVDQLLQATNTLMTSHGLPRTAVDPAAIQLALFLKSHEALQREMSKVSSLDDLTPDTAKKLRQGVEEELAS